MTVINKQINRGNYNFIHNGRQVAWLLSPVILNTSLKCIVCLEGLRKSEALKISHFQVSPGLCIKTRLSAQPLIWKWYLILMQTKLLSQERLCIWPHFEREGGFWNLEVAYRGINRDGHS